MLNKKGVFDDSTEIIFSIIIIIIGIGLLFVLHDMSKFRVDQARESTIESYDPKLSGTDLLNVAKLQITDDYTFADIVSKMPDNDPTLLNGILKQYFNNKLGCDNQLYNKLDEVLTPVYGENWIIYIHKDNEMIFFCSPITFDFSTSSTNNMTLPTSTPGQNVLLSLEVYNE